MNQQYIQAAIKKKGNNGLKNTISTLAIARTNNPYSATAQFFINVLENNFLNFHSENTKYGGYCVFGALVAGIDVIDKIKSVKTGHSGMQQDVAVEDVLIKSVTVSK